MAAPKKKKSAKNSNYKPVYKYVTADQICRKILCDYRNMPEPKEYLGEKKDVDENIYNRAVEFCAMAGVITADEKTEVFDGKNHVAMSNEEVSEFTGIPVYQIEKNLFAFKAKNADEEMRAGMIRLVFCDYVNAKIQNAIDTGEAIGDKEMRTIASYINFCAAAGLIDEEQSTSVYFMAKEAIPLSPPYIMGLTGFDEETYQKVREA